MATRLFHLQGLFQAIDVERRRQGLSWAALARQVGVSASTIRRFCEADDAEADGVLALIRWLGVAPEDYVNSDLVKGERLRRASDGFVRVDMELVARSGGDSRGARGRTRTSIQNLVEVAQRSGQTVASLTRISVGWPVPVSSLDLYGVQLDAVALGDVPGTKAHFVERARSAHMRAATEIRLSSKG